jgi:hypothetical protein
MVVTVNGHISFENCSKPDFCICFVKFIYKSLESAVKVQIYFSTLINYTVLKFSTSILASYLGIQLHTWLSRFEDLTTSKLNLLVLNLAAT